jgi:hypothetical protein
VNLVLKTSGSGDGLGFDTYVFRVKFIDWVAVTLGVTGALLIALSRKLDNRTRKGV